MKRRLKIIPFKDLERLFGDYVYRPHFPFGYPGKGILTLDEALSRAFIWFLREIPSYYHPRNYDYQRAGVHPILLIGLPALNPWEVFEWNVSGTSIEEFHSTLFREVIERGKNRNTRLKICVLVKNVDLLPQEQQIAYRQFQRRYCRGGFKSTLVLEKPQGFSHRDFPGTSSGIGFGDLLFVFINCQTDTIPESEE